MRIARIIPFTQACFLLLFLFAVASACRSKVKPPEHDIVKTEEAWEVRTSRNLQDNLAYALDNKGNLDDTFHLEYIKVANAVYKDNNYQLIWSIRGEPSRIADNLYTFVSNAKLYGLFPSDYAFGRLRHFRELMEKDSIAKKDAALWARHDLVLTNSFFSLVKDLKHGRLPYDSTTLRRDSLITDSFYLAQLNAVISLRQVNQVLEDLEPNHTGYDSIKAYLPRFLDSADFRPYTRLVYPYKDSIAFYGLLQQRLHEIGVLDSLKASPDTATIAPAVRKYQKARNLKVTGKPNESLVYSLNMTDYERFRSIAVNMDRYKHLPDTMPNTYVWVNIPSYLMT
ncbi:MAG: hypothetical protein WCF67_06030, partial [Chitinophagaceae bacterium]